MSDPGFSQPSDGTGAAMRAADAQKRHYDQLAAAYVEHYEDSGSLQYRKRFFDDPMLEGIDLAGREVLEAMAGSGQTTGTLLSRGARVTALDISEASIESFRKRWPQCRTVCASISSSGLADNSFDVVVVVAGLHHLHPDLDGAIDEIYRVLKPGGTFAFVEPYGRGLPDLFRRLWYKVDPLFLDNEAAIDIEGLRARNAGRFEFVKESYGGNIAYLLVLNSLVFRVPLAVKRLYTPAVLRLESGITPLLGKKLSTFVLGQWRKREGSPPMVSSSPSSNGRPLSLGSRFLHFLAESRPFFHYGRLPSYWGTFARLSSTIDLQPNERLLDVGCGTGVGARLARGMYVGLDTDMEHLRFARAHAPRPSCSFVKMSALSLGFAPRTFDKAVMINMVHHLDEGILDQFLAQLSGVVRDRAFVLDVAPDASNPVSRFFLGHDRGDHIRERAELRALLERHFDVEREEVFHNFLRTIPQVLFTLRPR